MPFTLDTKIEQLTRVGKSTAARLGKLGVRTVTDLLRHYPFRYDDFGLILPIAKLSAGTTATVGGQIELIANRRSPRRRMMLTEAVITDATGTIGAVWFNQPYLTRMFKPGDEVYAAGQVTYEFHQLQFINPSLELKRSFTLHTARLVPIYPTTVGLTQRQIRFLVQQALPACREIRDPLPPELRKLMTLPALAWSLQQVHFPDHRRNLDAALRRLKFDELLFLQLGIQLARQEIARSPALPIPFHAEPTKRFVEHLGFSLTEDQRKAAWKILQDIEKISPMNRLLEGEVGSGKTVVVATAALNVALAGNQTVVMAPTEILAEQHYRTFCRLFSGWPVSVGLLTRSRRAIHPRASNRPTASPHSLTKRQLVAKLQNGALDVVVGTHALLQGGV
ncbi:MAG: DEAD/DEAH box helicase, partial [Patescibacteria group bacterium]|nr:DEAD/DEAH box helicase [Patescibacteria group bacterium]